MSGTKPMDGDDMDKVLTSYFDKTVNSNTIKEKPIPSSELSKGDLLKILSYLEGEVQARDVVIATLKCERVKRLLADNKYSLTSDPFGALKRDAIATQGSYNSPESKEDVELLRLWESQKISVENLTRRQRGAMKHLNKILGDSQVLHSQVLAELEEEKAKNSGIKEGSSIRSELEMERQTRTRLEKELKEVREGFSEERERQKSIVLLLLAERKKILRRYVEEGKRSQDLLTMLEEEKRQALVMAEGLEEESQKALHMEAELERQGSVFRMERERLTGLNRLEEESRKELEAQYKVLRAETESLRKELAEAHSVAMFQATLTNSQGKKGPAQTSIIRPTATVCSVAVAQPTTGIAKSVSPVQQHPVSISPHPIPTNSNSLLHQTKSSGSEKTGSLLGGKKYSLGRGVPPPVPPNKPSVPPKSGSLAAKIHAAKLEQQIT